MNQFKHQQALNISKHYKNKANDQVSYLYHTLELLEQHKQVLLLIRA